MQRAGMGDRRRSAAPDAGGGCGRRRPLKSARPCLKGQSWWRRPTVCPCTGWPRQAWKLNSGVFLAWDEAAAVRLLTGQGRPRRLTVLETTRFGLPQAQFAWYDADAGRLCRADLILDGTTGYAWYAVSPRPGRGSGRRRPAGLRQLRPVHRRDGIGTLDRVFRRPRSCGKISGYWSGWGLLAWGRCDTILLISSE